MVQTGAIGFNESRHQNVLQLLKCLIFINANCDPTYNTCI